ncbi:MAG: M20/M25/M40 family metallo-hydrolase [Ramlibacter sp.]
MGNPLAHRHHLWARWLLPACLWLFASAGHAQPAVEPMLDPGLLAMAQQELPAVLETLRELTSVDSGTGQAAGLGAVVAQVERFAKGLGAEVERVTPANNVAGPNVVVTFKGTGQRKIMLMSHMDTVYVAGTAASRPLRIDGNRAIAPGIADDKGGIAVFLHAMKLLKARGFQDFERVTMVFTSDEERGSSGSRDLIRTRAQQHDMVLNGEPTGPQEAIVLATSGVGQLSARLRVGGPFAAADERPIEELADLILRSRNAEQQVPASRMNWTIARAHDPAGLDRLPAADFQFATLSFRLKGKASHAGVSPSLGVNAVVEMAALVRRTTDAAAQLPGARLHWRTVSGGLVGNVIPDQAMAVAEIALPKGADSALALEALSRRGTQPLLAGSEISVHATPGLLPRSSGAAEAFATADQRVPDPAAFAVLGQVARQLIGQQKFPSSQITVQGGLGFPAYNASEEGKRLAEMARAIYARLGGKLELLPRTYGGTDAVWAAQSGKPVVEGMGLPGGNYHSSEEEFVLIDRIPQRLALVAEMIRALARR